MQSKFWLCSYILPTSAVMTNTLLPTLWSPWVLVWAALIPLPPFSLPPSVLVVLAEPLEPCL